MTPLVILTVYLGVAGFYSLLLAIFYLLDLNLPNETSTEFTTLKRSKDSALRHRFMTPFCTITLVKTQRIPKERVLEFWGGALMIAVVNGFVTIPVTMYVMLSYVEWVNQFNILREMCVFLLAGCATDVWFYVTHLIAHQGTLYKLFHKMHHKYTAPVAISALYAHPIDFAVSALVSLMYIFPLYPPHIYTLCVYMFVVAFFNAFSHSGYELFIGDDLVLTAQYHDDHHRLFNKNYGNVYIMDKLFGTMYDPPKETCIEKQH
ncbi:AGAP002766-PA-like protein [Yasminevirus sp. GU-2018]|uniref:AGAP002766-PA-like protein n=1 Tax=Yasminevirus sp. GU-2018 TaxID=2420051 RepID=A0A5K0U7H0_9VIRU|nr:AGAP002766-PA-like protein [Yasminevirus sp. GU-2018]